MKAKTQTIRRAIVACALTCQAALVAAQTYPNRPVTVKVAYPAGGPADVAARKLQPGLQDAFKQPFVIENVPGAGGSIAARAVLGAPPDGYTLLVTTGNDAILAPLTVKSARYAAADLRLIAVIFPTDFALVTNTDHDFKDVDALVQASRAPGAAEMTYGTWGHGSAPHLVGVDFIASTGARILDVPYKGAAPVVAALLSKQIDMAFVPLAANVLSLAQAGKIRVVGIANTERNPHLPQVATLNEGKALRNFVYSAWAGLFVPASMPDSVVASLSETVGRLVKETEFQAFIRESGALPVTPITPAQAAALYRTEAEKYASVAKSINLEPQ
jgi:tripartite-type tricarboxylate transporter receptor subunit TctC